MKNYLIILSGGTGKRFGHKKPKQFYEIDGKTIFEHSIKNFDPKNYETVVVAVNKDYLSLCENILKNNGFKNVVWASNGKERQGSINNAVLAIKDKINKGDKILLTESVRPFIEKNLINSLWKNSKDNKLVIPCVKPFVLHALVEKNFKLIEKKDLVELQLPRMYDAITILQLVINYKSDSSKILDEAQLFLESGHQPKLIDGDRNNVKVTIFDDINHFKIK